MRLGIKDLFVRSSKCGPALKQEGSLKKLLSAIVIGGVGMIGLASVSVHPFRAARESVSDNPLLAGASVDPAVIQIVERSCQNCHSEKTEWPWYSSVAPMSWLIEKDVQEGRSHMNLSHWNEYDTAKQVEILASLSAVVRSRQMPLPRYLRLHPSAQLSDAEIDLIYQWTRAERRRLKSASSTTTSALSK
jgi:Haem-binding domain